MRKVDVVFLLSVFGVAGAFSLMSLSQVASLYSVKSDGDVAVVGAAGEPRDVDSEKLQRLLGQGYLSEHEAEFYKEHTPWSGPVEQTTESEEVGSGKNAP